jgi:hypothetical protein
MSSSSSGYASSSSVNTSFTMSPMPGVGSSLEPQGMPGYGNLYSQGEKADTPIYRPEATYAGPIQFGSEMDLGTGLPGEEQMLAAMQALKNPAWWDNMMMPGLVLFLCICEFGRC